MPETICNMAAEIYHGTKALSKSGLDQFRKSPAHFRAWQDGIATIESTPAMEFGTAAHMAVLEPEKFIARYTRFTGDKKTKDGKAAWQAIIDSGKTPLTQDQWDSVNGVAAAVLAHPAAAELIAGIDREHFEVSCFDNWMGVKVKARIDGLNKDYIIDLKTTQDASPHAFAKSIAQFKYHVQAAWYQTITKVDRFVFIAVEKEAPYGVACYELDQQAIDLGVSIIEETLPMFRECQALNSWPCYSSTTQTLSLPAWASRPETNQ
jgi:exodeoxyribonuclease VIII